MCQIVQRVWIGEWPNEQIEYLILKNGRCVCIRPTDHPKCDRAIQLPESLQLSQFVSPPLSVCLQLAGCVGGDHSSLHYYKEGVPKCHEQKRSSAS